MPGRAHPSRLINAVERICIGSSCGAKIESVLECAFAAARLVASFKSANNVIVQNVKKLALSDSRS
eukprot:3858556-Amphidinium_carterae.1